MTSNVGCWKRRLAVLVITTISLTACATVASDSRVATVCPPVVEYSRDFQARAADELDLLLERSAIAEILSDYSVMCVIRCGRALSDLRNIVILILTPLNL